MNEIENKIYFSDVIGYDKEKEERVRFLGIVNKN